ncbi:DNA alkylation repair protein [Enterococcus sp. BWR-S5]|uniref:DNA alkylation repair protein n=1 Tax=Enterococcus sp. BWR-S5 TaxID=2787714 RepID=UPI001920DFC6|nr:DNA alkylation repair protein [Enterococcus sp. BWR-S5]MBL1225755.1 DNA alkylation repair protein [Enterococcus sp. BWR-S5]
MKIEEVLAFLEEHSSEKYKKNVVKLGIPETETIGVATADLRKLAKKMPKEKVFIQALWSTGYHECKILAVLAMRPEDFSGQELTDFMEDIHSWDLCDLFCKSVLIEQADYEARIKNWVKEERLYYKRAAFTLIASTSTHAALTDEEISSHLELIKENSADDRLLVKKAVSWALRELGKTNEEAKEKSIATATWLTNQESKAQQWIGKDALKELLLLVKVSGRSRLISSKSKMGQELQK